MKYSIIPVGEVEHGVMDAITRLVINHVVVYIILSTVAVGKNTVLNWSIVKNISATKLWELNSQHMKILGYSL